MMAYVDIFGKRRFQDVLIKRSWLCFCAWFLSGELGSEVPRQQFLDAVDRVVGDVRLHLTQVRVRISESKPLRFADPIRS